MTNKPTVSNGSIGFLGGMFLLFLAFKLCGIIHWSWWWITAPLWGPILILVLIFIIAVLVVVFKDTANRKW